MENADPKTLVERHFKEAHRGTLAWSSAYHIAFGASAILSVLIAALSGKIGPALSVFGIQSQTLIALMAAGASVLTTVGGFGGFERKWRANRRSRSELEILMIEIDGGGIDKEAVFRRLRELLRDHESGVMAGPADAPRAKPLAR